jgi:small subunit ribosomal protein S1
LLTYELDVVLELDVDGRIFRSQTNCSNPWDQYEDSFAVGTIHNGEIAEIVDKGATVEFGDIVLLFLLVTLKRRW